MNFQTSVKTCLKDKYANFEGRASRSEYWWFMLFVILYCFITLLIGLFFIDFLDRIQSEVTSVLGVIFIGIGVISYIAMIVPGIAVTVRRFHDQDMSGWYYLLFIVAGYIPIIGLIATIWLYVMMAMQGTKGPNRFGPDPLGFNASADIFK